MELGSVNGTAKAKVSNFLNVNGEGVKLSKRELLVVGLLVQEKTNCEISRMLELDEKTISTYKLRALKKTGAKTIIGLYKLNLQQKELESVK